MLGCPQQTVEKIELGKVKRSGYLPEIFAILGLDLSLLTSKTEIEIGKATQPSLAKKPAPRKVHLLEWREHCHVTMAAAASAAKEDVDHYQFLERRPYKFTLEQLEDLAEAFGISFDQFWFPPPKGKPVASAAAPAKKRARK